MRVSGRGDEALAVGEAGVVVRTGGADPSITERLGPAIALYGVHMGADGDGQAVGGAGTVLLTDDFGANWRMLARETQATLRGVDDVHAGGHW